VAGWLGRSVLWLFLDDGGQTAGLDCCVACAGLGCVLGWAVCWAGLGQSEGVPWLSVCAL
jgi:hypothetical protein